MRWRAAAVVVHRWVGLVMAGFLLLAGLTGALLAWYHELDAMINPSLMRVVPPSPTTQARDGLWLRQQVQDAYPEARVNHVSFHQGAPEDARVFHADAASSGFDEVFVNPYTGDILGVRLWGDITQGVGNLMPFIYRLHHSLALGTVGSWALGIVAVLWTIDCFVGAWLTLPVAPRSGHRSAKAWWTRWASAWKLRWGGGATKLNFDLHRAGGLWPWALLFVLAWSSVAFNLHDEVYRPVMGTVFELQADPSRTRPTLATPAPQPALGWPAALAAAKARMDEVAHDKGFEVLAPDRASYDPEKGLVRYVVRSSRDLNERRGQTAVFVDAASGTLIGSKIPTGEAAGDTVTSWLTTLHMAHMWGLPFRVLMTSMGMAVAMLSVTGVLIWWKRRAARVTVRPCA